MEKENFSVFLDFDGVLNDFRSIPKWYKFGGLLVGRRDKNVFNPKSIEALNILLETLGNRYDVDLVLSTFWRINLDRCVDILKSNGLKFDGNIYSTPFILSNSRAREIIRYIDENDIKNYLVIDDMPHISKYFDENRTIKTSIFNNSLSPESVSDYLEKFHCDLSEDIDPQLT